MTDYELLELVSKMQVEIRNSTELQKCEEGARGVVSTVSVKRAIRPVLVALYGLQERVNKLEQKRSKNEKANEAKHV